MFTRSLLLSAALFLSAAPLAYADTSHGDTASAAADAAAWCQQNPQRCQEAKDRLKAKCDADPAKCEEARKKFQDRAAQCKASPDACKEEFDAKRDAFCKEHPNRPICQKATPTH